MTPTGNGPKSGRTRVLLAKPGLDGHDRGVKVIARACRDAGYEVIYTGIRQTPATIAETAVQEDVDVVGLSILSGAHLAATRDVIAELALRGAADIPVLVGGTISGLEVERLRETGAAAVFGVSSSLDSVVEAIGSLGRQPADEADRTEGRP